MIVILALAGFVIGMLLTTKVVQRLLGLCALLLLVWISILTLQDKPIPTPFHDLHHVSHPQSPHTLIAPAISTRRSP